MPGCPKSLVAFCGLKGVVPGLARAATLAGQMHWIYSPTGCPAIHLAIYPEHSMAHPGLLSPWTTTRK